MAVVAQKQAAVRKWEAVEQASVLDAAAHTPAGQRQSSSHSPDKTGPLVPPPLHTIHRICSFFLLDSNFKASDRTSTTN